MQLLRSYLFVTLWLATGAIAGIISVLIWPLPYRRRYAIVMIWNRFVVWWASACCGIRYRIIGNHWHTGPYVVLSKHQSTWETMFLQYYFGPVSTILKRELLRIPFFGWGLAVLRPVPIDRGSPIQALKKVKALCQQRLAEGNNVLVFPEGTRIPPGQTGNYARSGADIACAAGVPVIPVAHNAGECWPKLGIRKYPGTVTVVIGDPIPTSGRSSREITETVKAWIEGQMAAMEPAHKATEPEPAFKK
ncbi:1-acyl-sn-glycerol-3-phosphate acyltransferase [Exilibacterium tricleocarpae]|uniref:1-acyl-sn-glycerol-3-phosphate acyltransferase n=1 Tax=Exilibacterium tricleocarpae TaxID=2591008 RepID=A0A545T0F2_9GAMM|nr:lysophospholipid acyltransferase family protein [Exilibacterium tricleocarpae]TQV70680.1 1-acyl-sn-glycerol-3-phosphate acyltransferase [Exilibacterium tricleocarpae]